jgi:leucyl aminopeptidase
MTPRFKVVSRAAAGVPLAAVVFQDAKRLRWCAAAESFPKSVLDLAREDGFQGKTGGSFLVRVPGGRPAPRLILLSAGKPSDARLHTFRALAATAVKRAQDARLRRFALLLPDEWASPADTAQAAVEGVLLGLYRFDRHKSRRGAAPFVPEEVLLVSPRGAAGLTEAVERGSASADAVRFARDLINEPPSLKTPPVLARLAKSLGGRRLRVKVLGRPELARLGMNALLGVNRGSAHPPALVHLHYRPAGRPRKRIALVGKGVTFDSGGLSLKTADGMMGMKYDMSGAALVLAVVRAVARLGAPVEVHGVAAFTENMPGPDAYKPGDVVRAMNGKTIEVLNTDAEGRVILADALSYAAKLDVDEVIDAATLTGAASVALGRAYTALMTDNEPLGERLRRAGEKSGEKIWPLPLEDSYKDHMKSHVADMKNIGNAGEAGTIIGGLFLREFAGDKPWAHLDIAAAGWVTAATPLCPPGGTAVMVRTLIRYLADPGRNP